MTSTSGYTAINGDPKPVSGCSKTVTALIVFGALACAVIATFFITRAALPPVSPYDASTFGPYKMPYSYSAQMQFRIPYINFVEPIDVTVDKRNGLMKLSYFSGMDTYMFNAKKDSFSYSIVPVYTTLTCLKQYSDTATTLVDLFPDISLFKKADQQESVTITVDNASKTILCNVWTYSAGTVVSNTSESILPDSNGAGYAGSYFMYFDAETGL